MARKNWRVGDLYESCGGHPVLCTDAEEGDPHGGLYGISLVDGSEGHGCSKSACAPRRLTLKQALALREEVLNRRAERIMAAPKQGRRRPAP